MKPTSELKDIRIARVAHVQEDPREIPLDTWLEVIGEDPELEPIDFLMGRNPHTGNPVRILLAGGARWTRNPDGEPLPFYWELGEVVARAADAHTVRKAEQLAIRLSAQCMLSTD